MALGEASRRVATREKSAIWASLSDFASRVVAVAAARGGAWRLARLFLTGPALGIWCSVAILRRESAVVLPLLRVRRRVCTDSDFLSDGRISVANVDSRRAEGE